MMQVTENVMPRFSLLLMTSALCWGCVPHYEGPRAVLERSGEAELIVSSGGQRVEDHSQQLIHRVNIRESEVDYAVSDWPRKLKVPFSGVGVFDSEGEPIGFKILFGRPRHRSSHLGLQEGDLVTAIGKRHTADLRDLWHLFENLKKTRHASLTVVRKGVSHKILYYLQGSS